MIEFQLYKQCNQYCYKSVSINNLYIDEVSIIIIVRLKEKMRYLNIRCLQWYRDRQVVFILLFFFSFLLWGQADGHNSKYLFRFTQIIFFLNCHTNNMCVSVLIPNFQQNMPTNNK